MHATFLLARCQFDIKKSTENVEKHSETKGKILQRLFFVQIDSDARVHQSKAKISDIVDIVIGIFSGTNCTCLKGSERVGPVRLELFSP